MNVNLDYFDRTQPSLYIPYVHKNISEETIHQTIDEVNIGRIRRIILRQFTGKNGDKASSAIVEFDTWFRNDTADKVRRTIIQRDDNGKGKTFKLNYDRKYYWEISAYNPKPTEPKECKMSVKPTISFDDDFENEPRQRQPRERHTRERQPRERHPTERQPRERHPTERQQRERQQQNTIKPIRIKAEHENDVVEPMFCRPHSPDYPPPTYLTNQSQQPTSETTNDNMKKFKPIAKQFSFVDDSDSDDEKCQQTQQTSEVKYSSEVSKMLYEDLNN